ncbi:MAG TPA: hypothetical protein VK132_10705 [Gemmatimonadales bacterium]|nr:hypothetical protein [Gemmatimonadales bacterium]
MNGMKAGTMVAIAALLGVSAPLRASDQVVPGTRLSLKASNGKEKLSFKSKGTFTLPSAGGPDDPVNAGATFQIMNPGTGESFTFDLPKTHWSTTPAGTLFKYRDSALAESGKVTIALAGGRSLKVSGRRTGISLNETSQGALVTVLTLGSFRYCARFDDGAVSRDQPGAFSAKNAPPPASCPSLPTTTTTTSTTTSLTLPPMTLPALGHLSFTISPGTTSCGGPALSPPPAPPFSGEVDNLDSSKRSDLGLGCLYFGGGAGNFLPASPVPDGSTSVLAVTGIDGLALTVGPDPGSGPKDCTLGAGPDKVCSSGAPGTNGMGACTSDANCGGSIGACDLRANCFFGAPVPVPVSSITALTTCILNAIAVGAEGEADLLAMSTTVSTTLSSRVYVTGNFSSPCPQCVSGACNYGEQAGQPCTGLGVLNTTLDCLPDLGGFNGRLAVSLAPISTGTSTASDPAGTFCPGQVHPGAFGGEAGTITEMGSPLGADILNPFATTLAGTFCVPSTGNPLIDSLVDLPAPGAVSVPGMTSIALPSP